MLTIQESIVMTTQKNLQGVVIESDSHLMVSSIHENILIPKDNINLVKDIRSYFP